MAAFHAMWTLGFFRFVERESGGEHSLAGIGWRWWILGLGAAVAFMVCVVMVRGAWRKRSPIDKHDTRALVVLLLIPLCVNAILRAADFFSEPDLTSVVGTFVLTMGPVVLLACLPVYLLLRRFRRRLGETDIDWTPHVTTNSSRCEAFVGLCVLVGGWTGFAIPIATWMIDPHSVSMVRGVRYTPSLVDAFSTGAMGQIMGILLGTLAAFVVAVVPAGTRTDRSVPLIFLPVFILGVLGSLLDPLLGCCAAIVTGVFMAIIARRTYRIIPLGHCQKCGYDLTDNATGVCPECGAPVLRDTVWPFRT